MLLFARWIVLFALLLLFSTAGLRLAGQVVIDNDLVVLLTGDFTGGLGTGAGQVRWAGSGGFAAVGGDRVVQIGGSPGEISWTAPDFVGDGNTLILGDPNADGTLIWDKAINLGVINRSIRVLSGSGNTGRADARLDKPLRGNFFTIEGNGRLDITGNNPSLRRDITIEGAELRLNANGRLSGLTGTSSAIKIYRGGTLTLDNAGTSNAATGGQYRSDRLSDSFGRVRLESGTFRYIGRTGAGNSIESFDLINLYSGSNTIDIINNSAGFFSGVRVKTLRVTAESATVNFISSSGVSDFGDGARLRADLIVSLMGGILPYATVNGADWASANSFNTIISYFDYNTGAQTDWNSASINASPLADQVLNANRSINSLRLTGGRQVDLAGRTLTVIASALLSVGAENTIINSGVLRFSRQAYVHVYNIGGAGLTINSRITGEGLTKTGPGHLTLSGTIYNQIRGSVYVNEGLLIFRKSAGVAAIHQATVARLEIGDRGHSATVRLDNSEQIGNSMSVWLRGGFADPARHVGQGVEGILQFNGPRGAGLTETFRSLVVQGRGVLDFQGGTVERANFLILDDLRVLGAIDGGSVLLVRNWADFEDRLLVRRSSQNLSESLAHIHFVGYAPGAVTRDYNATFFEVIPLNLPEPGTYGAIFGTAVLGLWASRRRRRKLACNAVTAERGASSQPG